MRVLGADFSDGAATDARPGGFKEGGVSAVLDPPAPLGRVVDGVSGTGLTMAVTAVGNFFSLTVTDFGGLYPPAC
jgi:hypothetical protein